jgi:hypothetical protein
VVHRVIPAVPGGKVIELAGNEGAVVAVGTELLGVDRLTPPSSSRARPRNLRGRAPAQGSSATPSTTRAGAGSGLAGEADLVIVSGGLGPTARRRHARGDRAGIRARLTPDPTRSPEPRPAFAAGVPMPPPNRSRLIVSTAPRCWRTRSAPRRQRGERRDRTFFLLPGCRASRGADRVGDRAWLRDSAGTAARHRAPRASRSPACRVGVRSASRRLTAVRREG